MTVIAIYDIQSNKKSNIAQLRKELDQCQCKCDDIEGFLVDNQVPTLKNLNEDLCEDYYNYLIKWKGYSKKRARQGVALLKRLYQDFIKIEFAELLAEIEKCNFTRSVRNKATAYLVENDVKQLSDIDCFLRDQYISYLEQNIAKSKVVEYTKGMDRLKLHAIKNAHPLKQGQLTYSKTKIYLQYYPVYEIAESLYYTQDKDSLIWDFQIPAPENLKKQVFEILIYAIENIRDIKDLKVRYLLPLKWLYFFCAEHNIDDLEQLESNEIIAFREIITKKVKNVRNSMQIVDNARKILFLNSSETNWDASVWYLERFNFSRERMNPSNPVVKISFLDVLDTDNRMLLQKHVQYQIGITDRSIWSIRQKMYYSIDFLKFLDTEHLKINDLTPDVMDIFLNRLEESDVMPDTYNKKVISIYQFLKFLKVKGYIKRIPITIEYYLKNTIAVHHDRSVSKATIRTILHALKLIPTKLRLMYLHLWCIGLRINEVCTLMGDAYHFQNNTAWINVYQIKTRSYKCIPIPTVLFQLMVRYIEKNNIKPNEYIFQSAKGRAYNAGTYSKQFIGSLKEHGIECEDNFQSHDYRHTVATFLYTHGASLQVVRDYIGHRDDEMTAQYIDYLPNLVQQANEQYFDKQDNNLAAILKRKKKEENNG